MAYHDEQFSARSSLIDLAYHHKQCDHLFGIKKPADTDGVNQRFYQKLLLADQASQILFTNGGNDPWSNLSILKDLGSVQNPNDEYMTIGGSAHCEDLRSPSSGDSSALRDAKRLFSSLAQQWAK